MDVAPSVTAGIGMPDGGPISADLQAMMVDSHAQQLETLVEPYREQIRIETKVLVGTPFLEIVREVLRNVHDLVIKIPEHQDGLDRVFGSDDMHLLRKCPCPVWLIKPQTPKACRRILAAVDVDDAYPPKEMEARRTLNHQILEMASVDLKGVIIRRQLPRNDDALRAVVKLEKTKNRPTSHGSRLPHRPCWIFHCQHGGKSIWRGELLRTDSQAGRLGHTVTLEGS